MLPTLRNPDFERLVRESFEKQEAMRTLGARLMMTVTGRSDVVG